MPDKAWYSSVTIWGSILMVVAFILSQFGFNITSEEQTQLAQLIATIATAVAGLMGLIMVIVGRKKAGQEIKALKGMITKSLPVTKGALEFPKTFIDITEAIFGVEANALIAVGLFLKTSEGKDLIEVVRKAGQSEKGKVLLEQLEKVVRVKANA